MTVALTLTGGVGMAGCAGAPYPSGILIHVALGDQPALMELITAVHLSACVLALPKALPQPNGLVQFLERCDVDFGWCTQLPSGYSTTTPLPGFLSGRLGFRTRLVLSLRFLAVGFGFGRS